MIIGLVLRLTLGKNVHKSEHLEVGSDDRKNLICFGTNM